MENTPPPKPALPIDYAHFKATPKRAPLWAWLVLGMALVFLLMFLVMIFMPSMTRSPIAAHRIESASNLRQIGQAILLYTNDFHGQYPNTLGDLLLTEDITSIVLVSPSSTDTPAAGATTQATVANLAMPGHCSYVYLGKGLTTATQQPTMVIAYEQPAVNNGQGANVLFGDGHVEFDQTPDINSILKQTKTGIWPVYLPVMATTKP